MTELPRPREGGAWDGIQGTWNPLHGSFLGEGLSIEWHDFHVDRDMDWARSFHPGSLEICLNFSGHGLIRNGDIDCALGPNQLAAYALQGRGARAASTGFSPSSFRPASWAIISPMNSTS